MENQRRINGESTEKQRRSNRVIGEITEKSIQEIQPSLISLISL